jgi:hypothetical protein
VSKGIISDETIVSNHPWVTDTDAELKQLQKEKTADLAQFMMGRTETNNTEGMVNGE